MPDLYAKALPAAPKKKPHPRKCSTCADRECRQRGRICVRLEALQGLEGGTAQSLKTCSDGKLPTDYEFGG